MKAGQLATKRNVALVVLIIALAGFAAVALSRGDSTSDKYCDGFRSISDDAAQLDQTNSRDIEDLANRLEQLDPPSTLRDAHKGLIDAYQQLAEGGALTDPASASTLSQAQTHLSEIDSYIADNCKDS